MSLKTKIDIQRRVDTRQIDMLESVIVEREEGIHRILLVYFCDPCPWDRENFHFELISTKILTTGQTQT